MTPTLNKYKTDHTEFEIYRKSARNKDGRAPMGFKKWIKEGKPLAPITIINTAEASK